GQIIAENEAEHDPPLPARGAPDAHQADRCSGVQAFGRSGQSFRAPERLNARTPERLNALVAAAVGLAAFIVYFRTLAVSIMWGDSPELTAAAYHAGVPHP